MLFFRFFQCMQGCKTRGGKMKRNNWKSSFPGFDFLRLGWGWWWWCHCLMATGGRISPVRLMVFRSSVGFWGGGGSSSLSKADDVEHVFSFIWAKGFFSEGGQRRYFVWWKLSTRGLENFIGKVVVQQGIINTLWAFDAMGVFEFVVHTCLVYIRTRKCFDEICMTITNTVKILVKKCFKTFFFHKFIFIRIFSVLGPG